MNVGIAQRPKLGERVSGDSIALVERGASLLLMVCDGTGHGPPAAEASSLAAKTVRAHSELPLRDILELCGQALHGTRGGAVALLRLDSEQATMEFASVGNVEIRAASQHPMSAISSPGIVGRRVRKIHSFRYPLSPGDRFVVFTDGISRRLDARGYPEEEAQRVAERILEQFGCTHDDATCVVVDVGIGGSGRETPPAAAAGPTQDAAGSRPR